MITEKNHKLLTSQLFVTDCTKKGLASMIMFLLLQIYLTVFSFHLFVNFQRKEEYQTRKLLFKWSAVHCPIMQNCVSGVMVRVLTSSVVDRGFDPWSGRTKDYKLVLLLLC